MGMMGIKKNSTFDADSKKTVSKISLTPTPFSYETSLLYHLYVHGRNEVLWMVKCRIRNSKGSLPPDPNF
jgi:hypothetical protein